jgi:hypothetical protein
MSRSIGFLHIREVLTCQSPLHRPAILTAVVAILRYYRLIPRWHLKVTAVLIHILSILLLILPIELHMV